MIDDKKSSKILLISNMYPDEITPNYGIFVKNTEIILTCNDYIVDKVVMTKKYGKIKKIWSYLKHYIRIIKYGFRQEYFAIYVHYASHNSLPLLFISKFKKNINICTNLHGSDVVPENKIHSIFQPYVNKLLSISNCIIVPSNYYKDKVSEKYRVENSKIKVFPSGGINKECFYKQSDIEKRKYIGIVGRIEYKKGWDIFLKFVAEVKDLPEFKEYKFIVVGDGKQKKDYDKLVKELGIEQLIEKYDMLSQDELNDIYNKMEILCFPTLREGESLGLVGLEAMACGTPVVGSNMGGLTDYVVSGKNGYLFDPGNVENLVSAMKEYVTKSRQEKKEFEKNALQTAEKYEVANISNNLVDIFNEI